MRPFKIFLTALVVLFALIVTACPKDTAIHKAAKASYELSGITRDVIAATDKAYTQHDISLALKNKLAGELVLIAAGGKRFNEIATGVNNINTISTDKLQILNTILSNEIAGPFLSILQDISVLSLPQAVALKAALATLRTAILLISQVISENTYQRVLAAPIRGINAYA
jgi:hypothetical protein